MSLPEPSIFTSVLDSYLPEPQASLLNGILFGVNLQATTDFYLKLKMVGLLHLVVLSGINITLLASIVANTFSSFGRKIAILISMLTIFLFIIFVGPKAPIIRAGFMGILTLVSILYGRRAIALYLLFLSAVFTGIFWPSWLTSISFQLSYGATLGIILFGQVSGKTKKTNFSNKLKLAIWKELKPSLAAQLFTVPLIFFYFRQVSLIAPLSNLLISFLIGPLMILGFLTAIMGKIHPFLGLVPSYLSYGILSYIVMVVDILSRIPFSFFSF